MMHIVAWSESQDSANLVPTAALQDQSIQVSGDDVIVPNDMTQVIWYAAFGADLARAQLVSPSLRAIFSEEISPYSLSATPGSGLLIANKVQTPLILAAGEPLQAWMAESNAAASRVTIVAALADSIPQPVGGDIHTIRCTSTTAAVANVWTNVPLTFAESLPSGLYGVVGMYAQSSNMQAARLVFKGGMYRPGAVFTNSLGATQNTLFRNGSLGVWGTFENLTPPSMDVLCNAADASFVVFLDLIQLQAYR